MGLRNISAWSIRNPVVPIVLFTFLMAAGILSFMRMGVASQPNVEFPFVIATISQPGAAPSELENQVTQRVESAMRGINGLKNLSSTVREGSSQTFAEFEIGTDVNNAVNEVKSAIDQIRGSLPEGILEPQVVKEDTSSQPISNIAISATDMTLEQLSWFVDDAVAKRLLAVEGMAKVERWGGVDREIKVILDPARMQSLGVTAAQINNVLRQANINTGGGVAEIAGARQSVRVLGNVADARELAELQIPVGTKIVRLGDVATVRDGNSERTSIAAINGKESVNFAISRTKTASEVGVFDEAMKVLKKLEDENPGVKFTLLSNQVQYTKDQYHSSMAAMIEGAVLAVIIVFLFLRDWRATFISALAIPLSAIPTFWFISMMGFNLNSLVLLALSLVAGVLVDDAIVEIENIVRHMRMGKSAYQASIDAADEIGLAVVATTFSIVAVFFPVGMMPGIAGQFFKNFGFTVVIAVLVSLAVARMITPMIAAYFLKAHGEASHGEGRLMDGYMKILRWSMDDSSAQRIRAGITKVHSRLSYYAVPLGLGLLAMLAIIFKPAAPDAAAAGASADAAEAGIGAGQIFAGLLLGYPVGFLVGMILLLIVGAIIGRRREEGFLGWTGNLARRFYARIRDHRVWMLGFGVLAFLMTIGLLAVIPQEFEPKTNEDTVQARIEMVPGTTLQQTRAVGMQVEKLLLKQPEVSQVMVVAREGNGFVRANLKEERDLTSDEFTRKMTPLLQDIPDARVDFGRSDTGSGRPISIMLSGSDPDLLVKTANQVLSEMRGIKEIVAPRIVADMRRPELIIEPRTEIAASLGVTTAALSQTIRIATQGEIDQNAAKFSLSDRQIPIRVMLPEQSRENMAVIENLPVPTANGGSVPLSRVATIKFGAGPTTIQRYNQSRRVFIGADLAQGVVKSQAMDKINVLPTMKNLPTGVSNAPAGEDAWQAEFMTDFAIAIVTGLFLVFAVLVLLYHRFVAPLVNMTSLLLAPLGGLIALAIVGQPMSLPVYIGILMLIGIVGKNSILLIDFAIEEMAAGVPKKEAIIDAGHKRAQPIVMTTVAMAAGMVPTALSLSGDGAWRAPMGTTVIGGLIVSTVLTLLIVPAAFSLADGMEKRLSKLFKGKIITSGPDEEQYRESRMHGGLPPHPEPQPAE